MNPAPAPARPVPLETVRAAEVVKLNIARRYAHDVLARAERMANGDPKVMARILAQMADALNDAADMLRMRVARLEKQ